MRDSSTRSFNAAGPGRGGYGRGRRNKTKNILTVAILAVMVAIIVLTVLIILEIADCKGSGPDDGDKLDNNGNNTVFNSVSFEDKLYSTLDIHTGDLILINSTNHYIFPTEAPTLLDIYSNRNVLGTFASGNKIYSYYPQNATTSARFEADMMKNYLNVMTDDFYRATGNVDLFIYDKDGYRTEAEQDRLYQSSPTLYAPAGQTEHHTGKAVDFHVLVKKEDPVLNLDDSEFNGVYQWIYDNCYKYGFIHRYPANKASVTGVTYEPYHFRYVGYVHAYYMKTNGLCLEEYLDYIRDNHKKDSPLYVTGDNGSSYMIYYVPSSSESLTSISVPSADNADVSYTVSGDNREGFIVTVEKKGAVS